MKLENSISVIIPAYNESDILGETLGNLNFSWINEIIVVNDGSEDNTLEIAGKYPVKIIDLKNNKGKGRAISEGLKEASGDFIMLLDADLGRTVQEADKLLGPLSSGRAQAVIANLPVKGGGIGLVRNLADFGLKALTGKKLNAPLSGQRVLAREIIDKITPLTPGFGLEIGMDIDLLQQSIAVEEVDCNFNHRVTGQDLSGYIHRAGQFLAILKTLWQKRVEYEGMANEAGFN